MSRRSTLGAGMPVGSFSYAPIDNPLLTMADGTQWLRSGLAVASAGYPVAASLVHMRAHRFTRAATQISSISAIATDGAGTFVIAASGDSTNVFVSTDNGQTWTARAHNLGLSGSGVAAVVWTGARFVVVGNDGAPSVNAATSTNGTAWTLSTVASSGLSAVAGGSVDMCWNGTNVVVMVHGQDATHTIYTSPTGLSGTWTARTIPASSAPNISSRIAGAAFCTVYTYANGASGNVCYSTDGGLTWTLGTGHLPGSPVAGSKPMVGASWAAVVTAGGATVHYATALGAAWPQVAMSTSISAQRILPGSGGVWTSSNSAGQVLVTTDAINWTAQVGAETDSSKPLPAGSARWTCAGNASFVIGNSGTSDYPQFALSTLATPNGVGGSGSVAGLWRIK